jgi:NADH:ubiquinone oxidoreductase subunit K
LFLLLRILFLFLLLTENVGRIGEKFLRRHRCVVETLMKIELVWKAIQFFFLTVIFEMTSEGEGMVHFFLVLGEFWGLVCLL